ncbi:hypothetical protein K505DRAFT_329036 [Melanomma pulvis-pyrius CBS 109.77]|uniref:Uncharacterized protein n=1 Tax=Melanomma pulvis-pyrius CBS 109.77 TaxID=1314802 RepID=A0A6A6WWM7_9PLEO|nr:hypothetical protein K505DRAFT_329036 [Melanomma pulvis-pyrius CBS 109.77]
MVRFSITFLYYLGSCFLPLSLSLSLSQFLASSPYCPPDTLYNPLSQHPFSPLPNPPNSPTTDSATPIFQVPQHTR